MQQIREYGGQGKKKMQGMDFISQNAVDKILRNGVEVAMPQVWSSHSASLGALQV